MVVNYLWRAINGLFVMVAIVSVIFTPFSTAYAEGASWTGHAAPTTSTSSMDTLRAMGLTPALVALKSAPIPVESIIGTPNLAAKREEDILIETLTNRITIYGTLEGSPLKVMGRAASVMGEMLSTTNNNVLKEMVRRRMKLVILPSWMSFNDAIGGTHANFARLRGFAFVSQNDGSMATYLGEEEILQQGPGCQECHKSEHAAYYLLVHEWAHMVSLALPKEKQLALVDLFHSAITSRGKLPSEYAYYSIVEYFAEASALWFGVQDIEPTGAAWDADGNWFNARHPEMYAFLSSIYGRPRRMDTMRVFPGWLSEPQKDVIPDSSQAQRVWLNVPHDLEQFSAGLPAK